MEAVKSITEHPEASLPNLMECGKETDIAANRYIIIKCMIEASFFFCGKQCIALQDDNTTDSIPNRGNFLALLESFS